MKCYINYAIGILFLFSLCCCNDELQGLTKDSCGDPLALNYELLAKQKDKNNCNFSNVIFFALRDDSLDVIKFPLTLKIVGMADLVLDTSVAAAPQVCVDNINDVHIIELKSSDPLDWIAINDEETLLFSGTVKPNPVQRCIQVNIK